ncbi:RNAse P Rpr2/Rpp21/SNM1 subunit domain-containing protein [Cercophora scortea]|uniref:RNAse P Rpr2/Rpp21/SNM1 subunit domain-containing protein n=1 Tax=Cercophora scortea TaxID=314031 RepID=A0AAE0J2H3_9PEZI|nr:RNAse P Rpr2/Rpp21/SNM1 subunit domain-containing protein [Cercophora scortea]
MAKGDDKKNDRVQNRSLYSRVSFLHQAAAFLSSAQQPVTPVEISGEIVTGPPSTSATSVAASEVRSESEPGSRPATNLQTCSSSSLQGMGRRLATDLRSVSLKTRIRLGARVKQTICKFCDSILIEGQTCTSTVENTSKGGKKPWADVLVRQCYACGRERRYPVVGVRPRRKTERGDAAVDVTFASSDASTPRPQKQKQKQPQQQPSMQDTPMQDG